MKTVDLPALDHSGNLTPLVIDAIKHGAVAAHHPDDKGLITLTFSKAANANAFLKAVEAAEDGPATPEPLEDDEAPEDTSEAE
ncbi:hypothetical protein [Sphingomonas sp. CFBP 13706]|uniref:hypothetical protein n=1 Tax=Sphingomonas sp. CFBP 13706 TaxID=2775314 RepID=UPI001783DBCB|nr:hypothetical protein [Sphingomonas sp. CFBP 13706]MBD8734899.1 hypothetical protein [Sphingomonas sp. CFBP 13706]